MLVIEFVDGNELGFVAEFDEDADEELVVVEDVDTSENDDDDAVDDSVVAVVVAAAADYDPVAVADDTVAVE